MEETKKFYSQKAISIATYFGGPLAAGYLIKKNFEVLNQPDSGQKSLIIGIISTILLFAGIFSIPEPIIDKIPQPVIPLIYTGIIYLIVEKLQGKNLKEHKDSGGEFHSGWNAAGIGAIAMVILFGMLMLAGFIAGDLSNKSVDFDYVTYDKNVEKFIDNENKAIAVFNVIETSSPDHLLKEFSKGLVLWKENKELILSLNNIENLPIELKVQNEKLLQYCDLRIKHNEMIVKAISEDTDKYAIDIEKVGMEINNILEELK